MAIYHVEMEGSAREVYEIEADSAEDAMQNWAQGVLVIQESYGCEAVRAEVIDD